MLIYHYSKNHYRTLKSLNAQKHRSINNILEYGNHISFFLDPITKELPELYARYDKEHFFFKKGETYYEYIIDLEELRDVLFYLTENPEKNEKFHILKRQHMGPTEFKITLETVKEKYLFEDLEELKKAINSLDKTTIEYLEDLLKYIDDYTEESHLIEQYAPRVPHLMIYGNLLEIFYKSCKKVTL